MKGKKYGEYTYFGDINEFQQREGYGTLYDANGIYRSSIDPFEDA
jgi:hypothetical protein